MPTTPTPSGARGGLQYDERGRPYYVTADGQRNYVSPVAMGAEPSPDETGVFHSRPEWNQESGDWETPFDWGNLLNVGVGGLLGAGALSAAGAFGGAGGGTVSASPLLSEGGAAAGLPTAGMTPGLIGGAGIGAGAGTGMGVGGAAGMGAGAGAAAAGGGLADVLKRLGLTAGMMGIGKAIGGGGQTPIPPEIQQILDLQKQRMQLQNPLFEAISRLAMSRLPTAQQQAMPGGTGMNPMAALERVTNGGGAR